MADCKKLVLVVIDALKPAMLERAIATGRAPVLARLVRDGVYVEDCVAAFPSVTPVCAASIATGVGPDRHRVPSMNWYHREEARYVEYGSSLSASRRHGVLRSLTDTVYRLNGEHLARTAPTIFETLDDAEIRTAGTTYLIYRGRHEHEVAGETALARLVTSTLFRRTIEGPRELFYADLYASRRTGCRSRLGQPGIRDRHTGCVGAHLVEHDLFDFLLFSLPDNDAFSHRNGPHAQVTSIAAADRQLERLMHAGGGPDAFLEEHAVIVVSDHSQAPVEERIDLPRAFADFDLATPDAPQPPGAELAVSPAQRAAMLYVLDEDRPDAVRRRAVRTAAALPGVDLVMWREHDEAVVHTSRGDLRFAPGGDVRDAAGRAWSLEGEIDALEGRLEEGRLATPEYPDALTRIWSALTCPTAGEVLLSAAAGHEFADWGGADHVGGGSHGSLHRSDSEGALVLHGTGPRSRGERTVWTLRDVAPIIRAHFGVSTAADPSVSVAEPVATSRRSASGSER